MIDGDTLEVRFDSGIETIRLLGIDTPETVHPTKPIECHGPESSEHLHSLLPEGTEVRVERDQQFRDHFGRMLAYVYRTEDGLFVNLAQLTEGMADVSLIEPNTTYSAQFLLAESRARVHQRGKWSSC